MLDHETLTDSSDAFYRPLDGAIAQLVKPQLWFMEIKSSIAADCLFSHLLFFFL